MKKPFNIGFLLLACIASVAASLHGQVECGDTGKPDASVAAPRTDKPKFYTLHEEYLRRGKTGPIGVLFIGDSITERWNTVPELWEKSFGAWQPANFGIGGDQTQNVIWRIENGELDGIAPKVVVLLLGTNNSHQHSASEIAEADAKIVRMIQEKIPGTKILLLGIFPRGPRSNTNDDVYDAAKRMQVINGANLRLAKLADGEKVRYLNINTAFLSSNGKIPIEVMPDQLHLSPKGYEIWANELKGPLAEMMK